MITAAEVRQEADRLLSEFMAAGAVRVEAEILQPADTFLDLYGEDIRGRAYVTHDPFRGEHLLRPDFTVPVVQAHMAEGQEPARYTYAGAVFRAAENGASQAAETWQAGYEVFDRNDPVAADAEVFVRISELLTNVPVRAATGDIGVLMAAVNALDTSDKRRAALMRHIWRPAKFMKLLKRFSSATIERPKAGMPANYPAIGVRDVSEVMERSKTLEEEVTAPSLKGEDVAVIDQILALKEKSPEAVSQLRVMATNMPALMPAIDLIEARLDALANRGVQVDDLDFEGSYGRTSMEYYDGFVFGFYGVSDNVETAIATGGRYDALTSILGQGRSIPAVGGVIRPKALLELRGTV